MLVKESAKESARVVEHATADVLRTWADTLDNLTQLAKVTSQESAKESAREDRARAVASAVTRELRWVWQEYVGHLATQHDLISRQFRRG